MPTGGRKGPQRFFGGGGWLSSFSSSSFRPVSLDPLPPRRALLLFFRTPKIYFWRRRREEKPVVSSLPCCCWKWIQRFRCSFFCLGKGGKEGGSFSRVWGRHWLWRWLPPRQNIWKLALTDFVSILLTRSGYRDGGREERRGRTTG